MNSNACVCPACGSVLCSKASLYGHISFMRKCNDKAHVEYCNEVGVHKCPVCNWGFVRKSDVGNHATSQANNDIRHKEFYDQQLVLIQVLFDQGCTVNQIAEHTDVHFSQTWINNILRDLRSNIKCKICHEAFRDQSGLTSHLGKQSDSAHQQYLKEVGSKHYQKYTKERQCPVPGCVHKSVWLDRHMRMKIEQGDEDHVKYRDKHYKYTCPVCCKKLQSPQALIGHIHNLSETDSQHKDFVEKQKERIVQYFESGLCIDEIVKQPDIIYTFADGIYPIIHAGFDEETIHKRGRSSCGKKNKALIVANPEAFFARMDQARTQGSRAQRLCAQLLKKKLPEYTIKELDQDIFTGKEIDITIPEIRVAIEWQGPLHRRPIFGKKSLKNMQRSDKAKRTYFQRIGWKFIEVIDDGTSFSEKFVKEQVEKIAKEILSVQVFL